MNQEGQNAIQLKELHHNKEDAALGKTSDDDKTELCELTRALYITRSRLLFACVCMYTFIIPESTVCQSSKLCVIVMGNYACVFSYNL